MLRGDHHSETEAILPGAVPHKKIRDDDIAEVLRKTFLAMSDDIRVVLIKLADRLHNMRTLSYSSEENQKRIAQETLDIFTPLANRLGIWQVKWELEDLAFRYVAPKEYKEIAEKLANRRAIESGKSRRSSNGFKKNSKLKGLLPGFPVDPKHIYSIYNKMVRKEKTLRNADGPARGSG